MDEQRNKRQRGIESIAHLFLSELDKQREDSSGMRTPPAVNSAEQSSDRQDDITDFAADHDNEAGDNSGRDDFDFDLSGSLQGEIVLAYHLRDSYSKVHDYAEYQSQRDERVALVSIDQYEVSLLAVFNSEPLDQPVIIAETEGTAASLVPMINEAADGFDLIILNVDPSFAPRINEIISHADCVTVITDCTNDGIVSSYQVLKSVAADIEGDQEIALFVCDAVNEQYADRAYYKFSETARKFIDRTIIPAGCIILPESDDLENEEHHSDQQAAAEFSEEKDEESLDYIPIDTDNQIDDNEPVLEGIEIESSEGYQYDNDTEEHQEPDPECQEEINDIYNSEEVIVQADNVSDSETIESVRTDDIKYENEVVEEVAEPETAKTGSDNIDKDAGRFDYRPSVSAELSEYDEDSPSVTIFKSGQISGLEGLLSASNDSRQAVISRPLEVRQTGPAKVAPVEVVRQLENDLEVAHFIGMNLARMTEHKGLVSIELQQFEDTYPCARVKIGMDGRVHVIISGVFSDSVACCVEDVVQWLSDNIGAMATRYRILKIKASLPIQVILIAGTNFNSIYDEALVAADELDAECMVYQMSSFELGGKNYISLQCG